MNPLKNLKIAQKLIFLVAVAAIFISIVGFTGYFFATKNANTMNDMYVDRLLPVEQQNIIRSNLNQFQADLLEMSTSNKRNKAIELAKSDNDLIADTNKQISDYAATKLDPYEVENLPKLKELWSEIKPIIHNISESCIAGNYETGQRLILNNMSKFDKAADIAHG